MISRDGKDIYMGGISGLLRIDRERFKQYKSSVTPVVLLSDVDLDG